MKKINLPAAIGLLAVLASSVCADDAFHWVDGGAGVSDLKFGDAPVLRYMYAFDTSSKQSTHDTYKVFHHVFGPESGQMITKGPGGKYTHHRGLYVGWNKTETKDGTFDFWHCKDGAHLRHMQFVEKSGDANTGRMTAEIHWNDSDGRPVIRETRTVVVTPVRVADGRAWQIDWSTRLESQRGAIRLRGDRQHAGFQFRAHQAVADANSARFLRPASFPQQSAAIQVGDQGDPPQHINLNWFALHFPLNQSQYTVEYMEGPGQPRPSLYSERPYGRFGAFYKSDIDTDSPLQMTYRLIVSEGQAPSVDQIQQRYEAFFTAVKASQP